MWRQEEDTEGRISMEVETTVPLIKMMTKMAALSISDGSCHVYPKSNDLWKDCNSNSLNQKSQGCNHNGVVVVAEAMMDDAMIMLHRQ